MLMVKDTAVRPAANGRPKNADYRLPLDSDQKKLRFPRAFLAASCRGPRRLQGLQSRPPRSNPAGTPNAVSGENWRRVYWVPVDGSITMLPAKRRSSRSINTPKVPSRVPGRMAARSTSATSRSSQLGIDAGPIIKCCTWVEINGDGVCAPFYIHLRDHESRHGQRAPIGVRQCQTV